jgi:acyl-CoA thioester hydrolase
MQVISDSLYFEMKIQEKSMTPSRPLEIALSLPVRTYDIDFAGIVSNIVYVRWFEDMRLAMLDHSFPLAEQLQQGFAPIVLQTKIDYKQSIVLGDRPIGKMWVESLESLRWVVSAEIVTGDKISAIGQQMGIFLNLETKKPIKMPERMKQSYAAAIA